MESCSIDAPSWTFVSNSEADTDRLGSAIGAALEQGGIVALCGELGSGKTRLVRSIAAALGADTRFVNSPTFVLIQEYDGRLPIYHFDTYRLKDPAEFAALGVEEMFASGGVCLIEWADRVAELIPQDHLRVDIEAIEDRSRKFVIRANGPISNDANRRAQAVISEINS